MVPAAEVLIRTSPEMVLQSAKAVASAALLMVAVAWEQTEAVVAAK